MSLRERSDTYQAILYEGEARGEMCWRTECEKGLLLMLGEERFGPPCPQVEAAIRSLDDRQRVGAIARHLFSSSILGGSRRPPGW